MKRAAALLALVVFTGCGDMWDVKRRMDRETCAVVSPRANHHGAWIQHVKYHPKLPANLVVHPAYDSTCFVCFDGEDYCP